MDLTEYLQTLRRAIWKTHGTDAVHVRSVPVKETAEGQIVWEGEVEIFDLVGHAQAKRSYAWGFPRTEQAEPLNIFTVLELHPVVSPETAVHVTIVGRS